MRVIASASVSSAARTVKADGKFSDSLIARRSLFRRQGRQYSLNFERKVQNQAVVRIFQIQPGQLLDEFQTIHQRIAVNIQIRCRLCQIALRVEESVERA